MAPKHPDVEHDNNGESTSGLRSRKGHDSSHTTLKENKVEKSYTWQEVAKHNTSESAWMIVEGKVYNVTEWANKHPGGSEMVILHSGRDCTDTIISYHPFSEKPQKILAKYQIGVLKGDSEFPAYKADSGFYKEVRRRVGEYFQNKNINPKDPIPGLLRMIPVFVMAALSYCGMNGLLGISIFYQVLFAIVYGACQALPLLHVMHDCSHAAWTSNDKWWYAAGRFIFDWFAGGSMTSWLNQHVVGHHIYTNVLGADPDLPVNYESDLRRLVERQLFRPMYAFQHIYLPPLYGVLGLKFRIQDITDTLIDHSNGPQRVNPHTYTTVVLMLLSKCVWVFWRIYIPLTMFSISSMKFWLLFFLAEMVTGWYLAFNFQVSHISTEAAYPYDEKVQKSIEDEWAVAQVNTSVDYSHGSFLTTFLAGALNYQVTHHLFPCVSQYHYPAIAPIIQKVCQEYGIKYTHLPNFYSALKAHFQHLKNMGKQGVPISVHMG